MAVIDVAGFVADLKDHAVEHGFHVHDERHFVESYSLRQNWEVDLHPEEGCEGPVDLYLSLEIDPRVLLGFEDAVIERADDEDPPDDVPLPAQLHVGAAAAAARARSARARHRARRAWAVPTSRSRCRPSTRSRRPPTRPSGRCGSSPTSRCRCSDIRDGDEVPCEMLDRCLEVSRYLLDAAGDWLG